MSVHEFEVIAVRHLEEIVRRDSRRAGRRRCALALGAGDDREVGRSAAALERVVLAERVGDEFFEGIRIRRRSGWPAKVMPNMSNTSRSIQSAPAPQVRGGRERRVRIVDVRLA